MYKHLYIHNVEASLLPISTHSFSKRDLKQDFVPSMNTENMFMYTNRLEMWVATDILVENNGKYSKIKFESQK